MIKEGTWRVHSEIDPRWNNSGRSFDDTTYIPEMSEWIDKCFKEFGNPPKDATRSFWKD